MKSKIDTVQKTLELVIHQIRINSSIQLSLTIRYDFRIIDVILVSRN